MKGCALIKLHALAIASRVLSVAARIQFVKL